jgi:hypothetical protein
MLFARITNVITLFNTMNSFDVHYNIYLAVFEQEDPTKKLQSLMDIDRVMGSSTTTTYLQKEALLMQQRMQSLQNDFNTKDADIKEPPGLPSKKKDLQQLEEVYQWN